MYKIIRQITIYSVIYDFKFPFENIISFNFILKHYYKSDNNLYCLPAVTTYSVYDIDKSGGHINRVHGRIMYTL